MTEKRPCSYCNEPTTHMYYLNPICNKCMKDMGILVEI